MKAKEKAQPIKSDKLIVELPLDFSVQYTEGNEVIWARGRKDGIPMGRTSTKFNHDRTLPKIRLALVDALSELDAQIQLPLDLSNRISNAGASVTVKEALKKALNQSKKFGIEHWMSYPASLFGLASLYMMEALFQAISSLKQDPLDGKTAIIKFVKEEEADPKKIEQWVKAFFKHVLEVDRKMYPLHSVKADQQSKGRRDRNIKSPGVV